MNIRTDEFKSGDFMTGGHLSLSLKSQKKEQSSTKPFGCNAFDRYLRNFFGCEIRKSFYTKPIRLRNFDAISCTRTIPDNKW